jgi:lauroyl/myristoyl acyltransferase
MIKYFLFKFGLLVIRCVPRRSAQALARWIAKLHYRFSTKDRTAVINNLRQITQSGDGLEEKAKEVFRNFHLYLVDFFLMYRTVTDRFVEEKVVFRGRENLDRALARGKGVIVLTAHLGNWELGAAVMARIGHPVAAVALPHQERRINELFDRQRKNYGVDIIPTNAAVRRCIQALRKNRCLALVGDRDFGLDGEPLPFLGRPTRIPKGAAFFALRTGATILPSFIIPTGDGRYELAFHDPILPPVSPPSEDAAMVELMRSYVAVIEREIRRHPTHWLMFSEFGIEYEKPPLDPLVQRSAVARAGR